MIIDGHKIIKSFRCKKEIMEYLVYRKNIMVLSYDSKYYYFAYTKRLESALEKMPWHLKVLASFVKQENKNG